MITPKEWAEARGYTAAWARKLCQAGRIPGALEVEGRSRWLLPPDAEPVQVRQGRPKK